MGENTPAMEYLTQRRGRSGHIPRVLLLVADKELDVTRTDGAPVHRHRLLGIRRIREHDVPLPRRSAVHAISQQNARFVRFVFLEEIEDVLLRRLVRQSPHPDVAGVGSFPRASPVVMVVVIPPSSTSSVVALGTPSSVGGTDPVGILAAASPATAIGRGRYQTPMVIVDNVPGSSPSSPPAFLITVRGGRRQSSYRFLSPGIVAFVIKTVSQFERRIFHPQNVVVAARYRSFIPARLLTVDQPIVVVQESSPRIVPQMML
mmetsp:Transcript_9704/g.20990  ORF Transcript_9704/g.20990 Transcript_9704/m.20990 type:complete len:261 (-) Transcript_9704:718-1500(-)